MIPCEKSMDLADALHPGRILGMNKPKGNNCWICEKWNSVKITWSPQEEGWSGKFLQMFSMGVKKAEPVFLHMGQDDYEPSYMELNKESKEHEIIRAKPPGADTKFFISHRGIPKMCKRYQMIPLDEPMVKECVFTPEYIKTVRAAVVQTL